MNLASRQRLSSTNSPPLYTTPPSSSNSLLNIFLLLICIALSIGLCVFAGRIIRLEEDFYKNEELRIPPQTMNTMNALTEIENVISKSNNNNDGEESIKWYSWNFQTKSSVATLLRYPETGSIPGLNMGRFRGHTLSCRVGQKTVSDMDFSVFIDETTKDQFLLLQVDTELLTLKECVYAFALEIDDVV